MDTARINNILISSLLAFSCLYLAKYISVSPVYVLSVICVIPVISASFILKTKRVAYDSLILFLIFTLVLIRFPESLMTGHLTNLFIGILCYFTLGLLLKSGLPIKGINRTLDIILFIFAIECFIRLIYPTAPSEQMWRIINSSDSLWFYKYKFGSFMFADSNTSALFLLLIFFFMLSNQSYLKCSKTRIYFCFVLLILTFSRASILAMVLGVIHYNLAERLRSTTLFAAYGVIITLIGTVFILFVSSDGSFASKVYIFNIAKDIMLADGVWALFWGREIDYMFNNYSINSHILFVSIFLDLGLVIFLLYLIFFIYYAKTVSSYVVFPFLVSSLSYCLYYGFPLLFIILALHKYIKTHGRESYSGV